jgi:hypothetical protein
VAILDVQQKQKFCREKLPEANGFLLAFLLSDFSLHVSLSHTYLSLQLKKLRV